jgi:hypothetical protein
MPPVRACSRVFAQQAAQAEVRGMLHATTEGLVSKHASKLA